MESFVISSPVDSLQISCILCRPEGTPKGLVQLVHGMCEHKMRYTGFMEDLARAGYASVIHDHRGHGESVREKTDYGYMYGAGVNGLVEDTLAVAQKARQMVPEGKFILFGHSMGSMVVRSFAKRYDDLLDGLIVCGSPSYNPACSAGILLANVIGFFRGRHFCSNLLHNLSTGAYSKKFLHEGSAHAWVCTDPAMVKYYEDDPLCGFRFQVDAHKTLFALMKDCYSLKGWKCSKPNLPIFFISGADDPCMDGEEKGKMSLDRLAAVGYKPTRKVYPGLRHELLLEVDKKQVTEDLISFIEKI